LSNYLNYNNNLLTDDTQYTDLLGGENFERQTTTSMHCTMASCILLNTDECVILVFCSQPQTADAEYTLKNVLIYMTG